MRGTVARAICGFAAWVLTGGIVAAQDTGASAGDRLPPLAQVPMPHKPHAMRKPRHIAKSNAPAAASTSGAQAAASPDDHPLATATVPADPISLGMKWNGSSDNAQQTRVQNYDGNAPGTGAEVGLKLHF